jgi:hypothetical protein
VIDHDEHQVVATNNKKISDEIHGESHPRPIGDKERLKEAIWLLMSCLGGNAHVTRLN